MSFKTEIRIDICKKGFAIHVKLETNGMPRIGMDFLICRLREVNCGLVVKRRGFSKKICNCCVI